MSTSWFAGYLGRMRLDAELIRLMRNSAQLASGSQRGDGHRPHDGA